MTQTPAPEPVSVDDILRTAHDWRYLLNSPKATDGDRATFEAWLAADPRHADLYDHAVTFWSALDHLSKDDLNDRLLRPTLRERITSLTDCAYRLFTSMNPRLAAGGALAATAAVAFLVLSNMQFLSGPAGLVEPAIAHYSSETGEVKSITLSDGTLVTLGAGSVIQATYSDRARRVRLVDGVALFDVVSDPDRPFSVDAGKLTATALGTIFEVRSAANVFRVAVAEGEVVVSHPLVIDGTATAFISRKSLTPGQQIAATAGDGMKAAASVDVVSVGAWREDRLIYNGATLAELVADINRYSSKQIEIAEDSLFVSELKIRGAFNAGDIDGMLSVLEEVHPVTIDRREHGIVRIRAKG